MHDEKDSKPLEKRVAELEDLVSALARSVASGRDKLHLQSFSANPSKCSIGDLAVVGGKLKICTAADTWTIVGTQT